MKNLIVIAAFLLGFGTICNAQNIKAKDVPAQVQAAFSKLYPKITEVKWVKENGNYEAVIRLNEITNSVTFDAKGNLKETEAPINVSELPKPAMDYVKKNYPGEKIDASKTVDAKGVTTFEILVKKTNLLFDATGNFISKK